MRATHIGAVVLGVFPGIGDTLSRQEGRACVALVLVGWLPCSPRSAPAAPSSGSHRCAVMLTTPAAAFEVVNSEQIYSSVRGAGLGIGVSRL